MWNLPSDCDSGYQQWLDAMKMVARLPEGIPAEFRKKLWTTLARRYLHSKGINWETIERTCFNDRTNPDETELGIQIVKDLHRTGCSLFCGSTGEENQPLLKRVLLAYARWNKAIGYCQGFNMLAALILQVVDKSEADAFMIMIYLIEGVLPESYFANNLRGLSVDMIVFRELLRLKLPRLSKHLDLLQNDGKEGTSYEPPLTNVFTMQWFLTLFCNCLPQDTVLRVWDLIFLEGNEILLRAALAIWSILSDRIIAVKNADEFYSIMGVLAREMLEFGLVDANTLVKSIATYEVANELPDLREKQLYNMTPWSETMHSMAKKGVKLLYDDDVCEKMAVATTYGVRRREERRSSIQQYAFGHPDREKLALDISVLKQQYERLRERQRQAQIIFTAAYTRQPSQVPSVQSPIAINHLLLRNNTILNMNNLRLGAPDVPRPLSFHDTVVHENNNNETLHWKDAKKLRRNSQISTDGQEKKTDDGRKTDDADDDSGSSTSTELCDDGGKDGTDDEFEVIGSEDLEGFDGTFSGLALDFELKDREIEPEEQKSIHRSTHGSTEDLNGNDHEKAEGVPIFSPASPTHPSDDRIEAKIEAKVSTEDSLEELPVLVEEPVLFEEETLRTLAATVPDEPIDVTEDDTFLASERKVSFLPFEEPETFQSNPEPSLIHSNPILAKRFRNRTMFSTSSHPVPNFPSLFGDLDDKNLSLSSENLTLARRTVEKQRSLDMKWTYSPETSRRNSEMALKIIEENSLILNKLLKFRKSDEKKDGEENPKKMDSVRKPRPKSDIFEGLEVTENLFVFNPIRLKDEDVLEPDTRISSTWTATDVPTVNLIDFSRDNNPTEGLEALNRSVEPVERDSCENNAMESVQNQAEVVQEALEATKEPTWQGEEDRNVENLCHFPQNVSESILESSTTVETVLEASGNLLTFEEEEENIFETVLNLPTLKIDFSDDLNPWEVAVKASGSILTPTDCSEKDILGSSTSWGVVKTSKDPDITQSDLNDLTDPITPSTSQPNPSQPELFSQAMEQVNPPKSDLTEKFSTFQKIFDESSTYLRNFRLASKQRSLDLGVRSSTEEEDS